MVIISREEAKSKTLPRYFTNIPCRKGHLSERLTSFGKCITCNALQYAANRQKLIQKSRDYYKNNKLVQTKSRYKLKYQLSMDQFNTLYANQNGRCKLCEINFSKRTRPCVDHDHVTGHVRGILCDNCNTAIGKFKENINLLNKAIAYLQGKNEVIRVDLRIS